MSFARCLLVALMCVGSAHARGAFVSAESVQLEASRTLVARGADRAHVVTQVRYVGSPGKFVWLLALPNFNDPVEDGVRVRAFGQGGLDQLDAATRPLLQGACEGAPNGQSLEVVQASYGPAPAMALPTRTFSIPDIQAGRLGMYLDGQALTLDDTTQTAITEMIDQNFMFVAVLVDPATLGVDRVDPTVAIDYPLGAGSNVSVPLRPTAASAEGGVADLLFFVLDQNRVRANLTTEELDGATVSFDSPNTTDYLAAFDNTVGARQTQMFITEAATGLDGFADPELSQLITDTNAIFLTRLRARLQPAALRANKVFSLREAGTAVRARELPVAGFGCGGEEPMEDAGMVDPMEDASVAPTADAGDEPMPNVDAAVGGQTDGGSGGGGGSAGCFVNITERNSAPFWLLLFTPLALLRRRR